MKFLLRFRCKTRLCFQRCVFWGSGGFRSVFSVSTLDSSAFVQTLLLFFCGSWWRMYYPNEAQFWVPKTDETYSSLMGGHFKLDRLVFTENKSCFHTINLFVEVVFCNWAFEHQVWLHWFTQADLCRNGLDLSAFDSVCCLSSWNTTLVH